MGGDFPPTPKPALAGRGKFLWGDLVKSPAWQKVGKNDESNKTEYGLIAQEVEEVLKEEGAEYTGMLNITDEGMYELRYNDLISPMIKAIQELKVNSDLKENQLASLREENLKQYKRILELEKMIREMEWIQEKASYLINTVIEMTQNQTETTTKKQENKIFRNK